MVWNLKKPAVANIEFPRNRFTVASSSYIADLDLAASDCHDAAPDWRPWTTAPVTDVAGSWTCCRRGVEPGSPLTIWVRGVKVPKHWRASFPRYYSYIACSQCLRVRPDAQALLVTPSPSPSCLCQLLRFHKFSSQPRRLQASPTCTNRFFGGSPAALCCLLQHLHRTLPPRSTPHPPRRPPKLPHQHLPLPA